MASHLSGSELQIGDSQTVSSIVTSISRNYYQVPTSKAVKDFIDSLIDSFQLF